MCLGLGQCLLPTKNIHTYAFDIPISERYTHKCVYIYIIYICVYIYNVYISIYMCICVYICTYIGISMHTIYCIQNIASNQVLPFMGNREPDFKIIPLELH